MILSLKTPGMSAAPGALLLPNDTVIKRNPQPFASTNETRSNKTDQVINSAILYLCH